MTDKKISELTAGAPAQATDIIPAARSGGNVALTVADIVASLVDNLHMPVTDATPKGIIYAGANMFAHNFCGTFIGIGAGNLTSTGNNNIGIGLGGVQSAVTTANDNIGIGDAVHQALTTGSVNIALGDNVQNLLDEGNFNVGIGEQVQLKLTSGNDNIGIGDLVQKALTTGNDNIGIGDAALRQITTGSECVGIGTTALYSNSTGNKLIGIGSNAGKYATGSDELYIDMFDRTDTAGDKAGAIIFGEMNVTPSSQTLKFNVGSMGFFGHAVHAQPAKASHNSWAALSDVVAALVEIGLLDTA